MSLFTIATSTLISYAITAVSILYSYHNQQQARKAQQRAREEADRKADLAKGLSFTEEGQASALNVVYGRQKVGGTRVHFKVSADYNYSAIGSNGVVFESMKVADNSTILVWRLSNSNSDWTGTWSYAVSSVADFQANPGWIVTKEELAGWKYPDRAYDGDSITYAAPPVDFVFVTFKNYSDTSTKPTGSLASLGFEFPEKAGAVPVLNATITATKNEFFFFQQEHQFSIFL